MRESVKAAVLGVLLCGFLVAGCFDELLELMPDDGWGNNHSFDDAADITTEQFPGVVAGALITSPEDWFKFDAAGDATLAIICTPDLDENDVLLSLYNSDGVWLDDGLVVGSTVTLDYTGIGSGDPVTYYLLVEYVGIAGGDVYALTWDALP